MMSQNDIPVRRLLAASAFLGGSFTTVFGLARRTGGGAGAGVAGLVAMLWGMRELARGAEQHVRSDAVTTASEDSFPASDAPSWTPTSRSGGPKVH